MKILQTNDFLTCEKLDIKPITADALKKLGSVEKSLKRKLGLSKIEPIEYYESQNGKYRECIRLKLTSKELDAFNDIMYGIMKNSLPSTLTYQKLHDCIPFTEGYNQLNSVTMYAVFYHLGVWEEGIKIKHNPLETVLIIELTDKNKVDEKLNIQPVSKEKLGKYGSVKKYRTAEEMSENFQLGDIIVEKANHGFVRHNIYVYIPKASDSDYEYYIDNNIIFTADKLHLAFDLLVGVNDKGVLTNQAFNYDKSLKEYLIDDYYNYVDAVYRIPDLTYPLPKEYFKNPPIRKAVCVWKRRKPFLNEKLDIQPMSASRLHSVGNTDDMIKHSLLKKLEKMKSSWWRTDMTKTYMKLTLTEKELGMLNTLIQEGMADYTYEQQSLIRDFLPLDFGKNDMMLPVWQNIFGLFDIINQENISPNLRMIVDIKREK